MNYTKKDFRESTSLKMIWNRVITWHEFTLAAVMWDWNTWKVVSKDAKFHDITKDSYKPIAEFHTQEELWKYIIQL